MTDTTRNIGPAALTASAAAGPIALAVIGLGELLSGQALALRVDERSIGPGLSFVIAASLFATIVAIVPNLIGTHVMGRLGARNLGLRHPAMWALAGAAVAGLPVWLAAPQDPGHWIAAAWSGIGAISALVCRARVGWIEPGRD